MALYTMKEILADAREKRYGVGFFNATNLEMVRAYIRAAEECASPIIIGTAEALIPYSSFETIVPVMIAEAHKTRVPVAIHLDHTYTWDVLMLALKAGFGSIMYDGTREPSHADNVRKSADLAKICHAMGVGLECELGSVGGLTDGEGREDAMVYTDPDDAQAFVEQTGADFLAVSIGTQHGVYKATPKLDIPRLKEIRSKVDVPLVLHGGSGLSDDDFRSTIAGGVSKINVYTDIILAGRKALLENPSENYADACLRAETAMFEACVKKLRLFGSEGRA